MFHEILYARDSGGLTIGFVSDVNDSRMFWLCNRPWLARKRSFDRRGGRLCFGRELTRKAAVGFNDVNDGERGEVVVGEW